MKYERKIIGVEKRLGFMYIPSKAQELLPDVSGTINVTLNGKPRQLNYNVDYNRIFGLTEWYRKQGIDVESIVSVKIENDKVAISYKNNVTQASKLIKAKKTLDLSGLTSIEKGDIVEDRIKELILLYGQGLLSVYKPVVDKEGIDLIINKGGSYKVLFIQVKSRFNAVEKGKLVLTIKMQPPHYSYYIVAAAFNPETLELEDNLLLIPSSSVIADGIKLSSGKYRIMASLKPDSNDKWQKYFIHKNELASKLIEQLEEISKYLQ